ncbi:MAG: phenylalanine--tRNA ligase subunit alpha [Chloroflexi bacterium]|nr:phenylalanine--tRNA ligase subunit alpha [Chloroflexota bacterium]
MLKRLEDLQADTLAELEALTTMDELRTLRSRVLKGEITEILRSIGSLPPEERPAVGQLGNEVRQTLEAAFAEREEQIKAEELARELEEGAIDVTLPGRPVQTGRLHPATRTLREVINIWREMGFQVYLSRDVEDDDTNFTLLNIPQHHPARDMWDTFYTTRDGVILRTHTSPGQIHAMREYAPEPIRVILPGMVYRYEQVDATHEMQFNQVEGLVVGRNIRMSDLKGTMIAFAHRMYGPERRVRFRCSHFPFTEPSVEIDIEGDNGWLEIAGAGMVHPVVLKNGGYDPREYSGFAFGMGPERVTLLKHSIEDIRYFWQNDLRFLEQF